MSKKPETQKIITVTLSESQFSSFVNALEKLAKVIAATRIRENQSNEEKARFLQVFGLTQGEIANILGITQPAVSQALKIGQKTKEHKGISKDGGISKT